MMTLLLFWSLQAQMLNISAGWCSPPVIYVVTNQQRWLQIETGMPVKTVKRTKIELIKVAVTTRN